MDKDSIDFLKSNKEMIEIVYKDLAQPSVKQVGKALETVFSLCNTVLLPIKLLNERSKLNFTKLMNKYGETIKQIPQEKICHIPSEIGIPILDKFTYITDNEISDMFINLLNKASSIDTINQAHPKFIDLLNCLTVDEARIIKYIYENEKIIFAIEFLKKIKPKPEITPNIGLKKLTFSQHVSLSDVLTGLEKKVELIYHDNIGMYIENLVNLGILSLNIDEATENVEKYNGIQKLYNFGKEYESKINDNEIESIVIKPYQYKITKFGDKFIKACLKTT